MTASAARAAPWAASLPLTLPDPEDRAREIELPDARPGGEGSERASGVQDRRALVVALDDAEKCRDRGCVAADRGEVKGRPGHGVPVWEVRSGTGFEERLDSVGLSALCRRVEGRRLSGRRASTFAPCSSIRIAILTASQELAAACRSIPRESARASWRLMRSRIAPGASCSRSLMMVSALSAAFLPWSVSQACDCVLLGVDLVLSVHGVSSISGGLT